MLRRVPEQRAGTQYLGINGGRDNRATGQNWAWVPPSKASKDGRIWVSRDDEGPRSDSPAGLLGKKQDSRAKQA